MSFSAAKSPVDLSEHEFAARLTPHVSSVAHEHKALLNGLAPSLSKLSKTERAALQKSEADWAGLEQQFARLMMALDHPESGLQRKLTAAAARDADLHNRISNTHRAINALTAVSQVSVVVCCVLISFAVLCRC